MAIPLTYSRLDPDQKSIWVSMCQVYELAHVNSKTWHCHRVNSSVAMANQIHLLCWIWRPGYSLHLWIQIIRCIHPCWSNCRAGLWPPFKLEIVHAALLYINCFHWSLNTPRLDPTRCQLMENTPDLNWAIFDPDQVGGITTKVLGSVPSTRYPPSGYRINWALVQPCCR